MTADEGLTPYDRGLMELDKYLYHLDDPSLARAVDAFRRVVETAPDVAAHWRALGYVLDQSELSEEALAAFRRAAQLDPDDHVVEVYVLTLLAESGAEREALAATQAVADRTGVDLDALRRELAAADMPVDSLTLIRNAFIRARNFLKSGLMDEIEAAERRIDPARWKHLREVERRECDEMQQELQRSLDPGRVPADFRALTSWAARLGIGDDFCRGRLAEDLTEAERSEVFRAVGEHAAHIQAWLDGFDPAAMSEEAAAFMYLLLGVEEMDGGAL